MYPLAFSEADYQPFYPENWKAGTLPAELLPRSDTLGMSFCLLFSLDILYDHINTLYGHNANPQCFFQTQGLKQSACLSKAGTQE